MRLFIASTFPETATRAINERIARVRTKLPPASWTRPESQHLTFAFLGEQDEALVATISSPLETALAAVPAFTASMRGCGFFPNARRARVGWIGLKPEEPFCAVSRAVREVVTRAGVTLDRADFRPHLTIMRIRDNWPPASITMFEDACRDYESPEFVVDKVTLYKSQLNPKGAIHTALKEFRLEGT